ncbi:hypothetical protein EI94DRAFT_1496338, partial [Lactarius quietus]
ISLSHSNRSKSTIVEKDVPLDVDAGFLTVTDPNLINKETYELYPQSTARDSIQLLLVVHFSLPTLPSPEGLLAQPPP